MTGRWFGLICIAFMIAFGYWVFPMVQTEVPLHSNENAVVDLKASPFEAVVLPPLIASLLYLIMVVHRRSHSGSGHEQFIDHLAWLLMNLAIAVLCVMYFAVIGRYLGLITEVRRAVVFSIGMAFVTIGYYLPRTKQEEWIGLRSPWTLASKTVWAKTHLFGRWTFVVGGAIIGLASWLPKEERRTVSMLGVLLATLLPLLYSYVIWRREKSSSEDSQSIHPKSSDV